MPAFSTCRGYAHWLEQFGTGPPDYLFYVNNKEAT